MFSKSKLTSFLAYGSWTTDRISEFLSWHTFSVFDLEFFFLCRERTSLEIKPRRNWGPPQFPKIRWRSFPKSVAIPHEHSNVFGETDFGIFLFPSPPSKMRNEVEGKLRPANTREDVLFDPRVSVGIRAGVHGE